MSSRPSVYVRKFAEAPTLPSPNATIEGVTVDLRVFYPPTSEGVDIALASLASAYIEATEELQARHRQPATGQAASEGASSAGLPPEERNT